MRLKKNLQQSQYKSLDQFNIYSTRILGLNNTSLYEEIRIQLEENFLLEESLDYSSSAKKNDLSKPLSVQPNVIYQESLMEALLQQFRDNNSNARERKLAFLIISSLDEHGLLNPKIDFKENGFHKKEIEKIRKKILLLSPIGCAAMSPLEAVLTQIRSYYPDYKFLKNMSEQDLFLIYKEELFRNKFHLTAKEYADVRQIIGKAYFFPALAYQKKHTQNLIPDIIVQERNHKVNFIINDYWLPIVELRMSSYRKYLSKIQQNKKSEKNIIDLKHKLKAGQNLLYSIHRRRDTIQRIMKYLLKTHSELFLSKSKDLLENQKIDIEQCTQNLQMSASTIRRAIFNKKIQTRQNTILGRKLFSSHVTDQKNNRNKMLYEIWQHIIEEKKISPMTDAQLYRVLLQKGYVISKRTVTKYREQLKIPNSRDRKNTK